MFFVAFAVFLSAAIYISPVVPPRRREWLPSLRKWRRTVSSELLIVFFNYSLNVLTSDYNSMLHTQFFLSTPPTTLFTTMITSIVFKHCGTAAVRSERVSDPSHHVHHACMHVNSRLKLTSVLVHWLTYIPVAEWSSSSYSV